ncbi:E3 ubiquitin-protein ligase RBX1 [Pancytospora philotis]|nr:E3 ubiquitin-protein ligase RBX1 [Pancytospora philotis]
METKDAPPEITLLGWDIVGLWSFDIQIETCAICRNHIMDTCVECQNGPDAAGSCHVSWGKCGHAFHAHCIDRWRTMRNVCPLDTEPWVEDKTKKE